MSGDGRVTMEDVMPTRPCTFCGGEVPPDTTDDLLDVDGEMYFDICDACARTAWHPDDGAGNLDLARARLGVFPELASLAEGER